MTRQAIVKRVDSPFLLAKRYLALIFLLNDIHVTKRELDILAFTAIRGSISTVAAKRDCLEKFQISNSSLNNTVSTLQQKKLLVKDGKTKLNPALSIDFSGDLQLRIDILHDTK